MTADVVQADCRDALMDVEPESVPAIVTDPPYGLHFMGKAWDYDLPGASCWRHCFRVLKPGAFMLVFGGTRTFHRLACDVEDAGFFLQDTVLWLYGQGFPKGKNALKPAWEPVLLWRKPGKSALNVEACRVDMCGEVVTTTQGQSAAQQAGDMYSGRDNRSGRAFRSEPGGRWPANLILDEEAAAALDEQSGERKAGGSKRCKGQQHGFMSPRSSLRKHNYLSHGDTGGASRFFYCAKARPSERNAGCEGLPEKARRTLAGGTLGPCENAKPNPQEPVAAGNTHPTVKPVALMRYLCRLIVPPGGLVVDPFCGSGSTGVAAIQEGFHFLGIDKDEEACTIARARLAHALVEAQPQERQAAGE